VATIIKQAALAPSPQPLLFRASSGVVAPQSCLKVLYQLLVVEWLAQETYRARLKGSPADLFFGKRCYEDHWRAVAPRDQ
jgi:hypothetical protein